MNKKAIFILGGALNQVGGRWRTTGFQDGDEFGVTGDRLRVIAAEYLYQDNPDLKIIVSGGRGQYQGRSEMPTIAEVLKQELIERGVPSGNIILEDKSGNTWEQLQALKSLLAQKKINDVAIISNEYHLPRIKAMIENLDLGLAQMLQENKIKLLAAEQVLVERKPEWKKEIDEAYLLPGMAERIALEQKGVQDIKEGKYKIK